ncbi:NAD(P)H-dependent flavin oxidoreductase [Candidatus Marimicrobium litorale]|jgi:NAD(P)H-dependent flavin oxidoreductase YrpB (nitropropane dioxygenase family)|uniref:Nitronate monooxygenase n=1 Tax=Candidatus Marimicrobium litorale TaxID=2518991 RepID=A0ABT3T699_9GAMM|nr:nitronate monooxygenase family protein [Candidatus Marimicrobium litorale]MCX2977009.1 nitronate monooxygenase [Candidatus Marimicrobium litorale]
MQTDFCKELGIEVPIFAFTHCRDVVVAVSKAGGIGVLGAVGFSPEKLKEELDWIDEHIGDHIYGVDTAIPQKYEGMDKNTPEELVQMLQDAIPEQHREFSAKMLADAGVPEWPAGEDDEVTLSFSAVQAQALVDESLTRPKCRMIVNALGTPPADIVEQVHKSGRLIGALAGRLKHGLAHKEAGLDFIICQGSEGGGHAGEVTSMVLWPQMIDAVAPLPVLAAGGIGNGRQIVAALAMGAEGVWLGSRWLVSEEAHAEPAQRESYLSATSEDTIRSRSFTGKTARMLKNEWTEAWEREDTPEPLPMPLQGYLTFDAVRRTSRYAGSGDCQKVAFNPIGQVVGQINETESCRDIVFQLLTEYTDALDHLNNLMPED